MKRRAFITKVFAAAAIPIIPLRIRRNIPADQVPFLLGWARRKKFSITSSDEVADTIIEFFVYNTSGTDTTTEVYLSGDIRTDWGDLRFSRADGTTKLPFAILQRDSTFIKVAVNLGTVQNGDYYIYYDGPAESLFKIGHVTDIHYNTGEILDNRGQSLDFCDSFVERMETYLPDLVAKGGDDIGSDDEDQTIRLGYMQAVIDHIAPAASGPSTPEVMHLAPGNHDFDFTSFSATRAVLTQSWMETNTLYGSKEVGPYLIVSLDANYTPNTQTHKSNTHQGYGYVNTNQLTWLQNVLNAATKPVIIFCHQPLSEMDTDQFTLTKETYHTQNRVAIRAILEASNKVVCCIHGHVHYSRNDIINEIPYITCTNIGNTGQFGEQPAVNAGKWQLIDLDSSSQTIRVRTEAVMSGVVELIYEQYIPFGRTQYFPDVSNNHEEVYALGNNATYDKASFLRDPTIAYVANDQHLYKYPRNLKTPDPYLSDNTIRINGRTNTPNFGRAQWYFSPRNGIFQVQFHARIATVKTKQIRFGDSSIASTPGVQIYFNNDGNISAHDGASLTNVKGYVIDTWYKFLIIINVSAQTFSLYIDDILEAEDFSFTNAIDPMNRMEIVTETGNFYIDSCRVQPFHNAEISSFQTEQTA